MYAVVALNVLLLVYASVYAGTNISNEIEDVAPKKVGCWNDDSWMIGDVPNPKDCTKYYTCTLKNTFQTVPLERKCQLGYNNTPLFFDYQKCLCDYTANGCYQGHPGQAEFFNCARRWSDQLK